MYVDSYSIALIVYVVLYVLVKVAFMVYPKYKKGTLEAYWNFDKMKKRALKERQRAHFNSYFKDYADNL